MKNDITLYKTNSTIYLKQIYKKSDILKEDETDGYLIDTFGDEKEARRIIESLKSKNKIIALIGKDNIFNRRVLETLKINYLVSSEKYEKRDTIKQRDSGINHVTAKIAKEKNIVLLIDFLDLQRTKDKQLALRLERIIQNIKICKKTNTEIKIATLSKNKKDKIDLNILQDFMIGLGASTKQAKNSIQFYLDPSIK